MPDQEPAAPSAGRPTTRQLDEAAHALDDELGDTELVADVIVEVGQVNADGLRRMTRGGCSTVL